MTRAPLLILATLALPALAAPTTANLQPATPQAAASDPHQLGVNDARPGKDGVKRLLVLRGLDKITGRPQNIYAPIGVPVKFATFTITADYCYSTPPSEPPETTAFVQVTDARPDQPARKLFSGWMLASSPSLNGVQHPLYDVWVIACQTNVAGQAAPTVASTAKVKVKSPDAGAKEQLPTLPEDSGQ